MNINSPITIVYMIGAGRSGTTILSTLLGASRFAFSSAELMQFYEYIRDNKVCGDGVNIGESIFWRHVIEKFEVIDITNIDRLIERNHSLEFHSAFVKNLFNLQNTHELRDYLNELAELYHTISVVSNKNVIIDSSKYPNRGILLSKLKGNFRIKYIYNVRDVRGVINSFNKKVQTTKSPLSTVAYYNIINIMAEITYRLLPKNDRIKVRYEDLVADDFKTIGKKFHR